MLILSTIILCSLYLVFIIPEKRTPWSTSRVVSINDTEPVSNFFFYSDLCLTIVCVFPSFLFFFLLLQFVSFLFLPSSFSLEYVGPYADHRHLWDVWFYRKIPFSFFPFKLCHLLCTEIYFKLLFISFFFLSFAFFCTLYILCEVAFVLVCMTKYCVPLLWRTAELASANRSRKDSIT